MEIRPIDGESYISLTHWDVGDDGMMAAMAVRDGDFAGAYEKVSFFRTDFAAFIEALAAFTVAHEGEARLESISPGEAVVYIRRLDAAHHVLAEVQVSRWHYVRARGFRNQVSVAFELDPSQVPDVARNLAAVIAEAKPS